MNRFLILISVVFFTSSSACSVKIGSSYQEQLQKRIVEFLAKHDIQNATAVCPEKIEADDSEFACTATVNDLTIDFKASLSKNKQYTWRAVSGVISPKIISVHVATTLKERNKISVNIDCGEKLLLSKKGAKYDCGVTDDFGGTARVEVVVTDDKGKFNWNLLDVVPGPGKSEGISSSKTDSKTN